MIIAMMIIIIIAMMIIIIIAMKMMIIAMMMMMKIASNRSDLNATSRLKVIVQIITKTPLT